MPSFLQLQGVSRIPLKVKVKSLNHVRLFATPWTVAYQTPLSMDRQEYWSGLPFPSPGDLPNPGTEPRSPALEADTLPSEPPGKPLSQASNDGWSFIEDLRVSWEKWPRRCWNWLSNQGIRKIESSIKEQNFSWNLPGSPRENVAHFIWTINKLTLKNACLTSKLDVVPGSGVNGQPAGLGGRVV